VSVAYLSALVFALLGTGLLDWRHRLAFWGGAPYRTTVVVALGVGFFLAWDVVGIAEGIFFRGTGPWMTGVLLGPELPVEELFFLMLLCYSTLIAYLLAVKVRAPRSTS
jgi:lycopene cyclase domain-containing protein